MILTFFLLSLLVLFLDQWTGGWSTMHLFCVYRSSLKDPLFYIRLFGHVLGHASWDHFLNNMLLLLVVGPPMEEKYGSKPLLCGMVFTALVTGVLQCVLFPRSGLLGASGGCSCWKTSPLLPVCGGCAAHCNSQRLCRISRPQCA